MDTEPHPNASLAQALKAEAWRLGFAWAGITHAGPAQHFDFFENWLEAGRHAGMAYLAAERSRQRRQDPRRILPECRSILILAEAYPLPAPSAAPATMGQVAAYARGIDYHISFPPRLQALVQFLEAQTGQAVSQRAYTDSGPLLERELAQRAGLGWIGKNGSLIHPQLGSSFLLAEILLGIELPPDPPFAGDRCGTCRRCIEACPTGCILPDRSIDAGRCISYLTIESKAAIPAALRPALGHWIFGCDICQQVCPWNRKPAAARPSTPFELDLLAVLDLSPQEFNRRFRGSPLERPHRRGLLRNALVALGNALSSGRFSPSGHLPGPEPAFNQAFELLARLLHDPEPLLRQHAAWAIGQMPTGAGRACLLQALESETDPAVRQEIQSACCRDAC